MIYKKHFSDIKGIEPVPILNFQNNQLINAATTTKTIISFFKLIAIVKRATFAL